MKSEKPADKQPDELNCANPSFFRQYFKEYTGTKLKKIRDSGGWLQLNRVRTSHSRVQIRGSRVRVREPRSRMYGL
jgi:hypothetical protein